MRNFYSIVLIFFVKIGIFATTVNVNTTITPTVIINESNQVTVSFSGAQIDESVWGTSNHTLYLWSWCYYGASGTSTKDALSNGMWGTPGGGSQLTYDSATDTYSMSFYPTLFFGVTGIARIGFLIKNYSGSYQSQDTTANVGFFFTNSTYDNGSISYVASGSNVSFSAGVSAGSTIAVTVSNNSGNNTTNYGSSASPTTSVPSTSLTITGPTTVTITATEVSSPNRVITESFYFDLAATTTSAVMPGWMRQGITYDPADATRVGLAIYAPFKAGFHIVGSFNNWAPFNTYKMQRDTANPDVFWIVVSGLTPQQVYTFQYISDDGVKVADPFSRLVLSPDDDSGISASTYPNMPGYPSGQSYDVSVIQTGMPAYNWTVTNFVKPAKEKLVVYELLVRDFTSGANWASTQAKIPYLKTLGINAIELMPVMEFDGNSSWGYNPGFHYALDKSYGTPDAFKQFIDTCHQNGIAVILDIALNHATGRSPIERLWAVVADSNGNPTSTPTTSYGAVAANNPYFNQYPKHSYNVFYDLNHSAPCTQYYTQRVLEQWISEYKVDGFRWDLTKGFTQACSDGNNTCTDQYQADRVAILKTYADYQWSLDPTTYVIFEHLGTDAEEQQWANYRSNEGKGVMMWDKLTNEYNQNTMGYNTSNNFSKANFQAHGFTEPRAMNFGESHDEERLMYKNLQYGIVNGSYNVKDLPTALNRMKAFGAVFLTIPGPKMIWEFGELGYDLSIFRCTDGTVSSNCKLSPKPSAFTLNYDTNTDRKALYDTWAKINSIVAANQIFQSKSFTINTDYISSLAPRIYITDGYGVVTQNLKNVVILANFNSVTQSITTSFDQNIPQWYDLMDPSAPPIATTVSSISLAPGEFRIFGDAQAALATNEAKNPQTFFKVAPNPITDKTAHITVNGAKNAKIFVYDLTGKMLGSQKLSVSDGTESIPMPYPAGLYLLQLKSDEGSASAKVILK